MKALPNPFYYLENFHQVLDWISERYSDLLLEWEAAWISDYRTLPQASRALLVRLVMRKGTLFRSSKLKYEGIGCPHEAAKELVNAGWVEDCPLLCAEELFGLLNKSELTDLVKNRACLPSGIKKADLFGVLQEHIPLSFAFHDLFPDSEERVYRLTEEVASFCDRLRLLFFGNLYQDWTEFVLADLGIYQYEKVIIDVQSRGFQSRGDVDAYLHLHACRERFHEGESPEAILAELSNVPENSWLAGRRAKLLFQLGRDYEQKNELDKALAIYKECSYPEARLRTIRVLEKNGETNAAHELALMAQKAPGSDEEAQNLERILPRLRRKLGMPKQPQQATPSVEEWLLTLAYPESEFSVEMEVCRHMYLDEAPVFYVENSLINSLFGLLCWDAVFYPLPGAFFHPFQTGPIDLHSPDFYRRRMTQFDACLSQLDSAVYKTTILSRFAEKAGIQSPFVFWGALDRSIIELALDCISPIHLRHWFIRILQDVKANRAGFPDLVQFFPLEKRYRLIEVKGPGDRLQDNQVRLLNFAQSHDMPVTVCYVEWAKETAWKAA